MSEKALALAERIVALRSELAEAEAEFQKLVGGGARGSARKLAKPGTDKVPAAVRVRNLLKDERKPLSFTQIAEVVSAPREAIKSALKKARERGEVGYRQFKYYWK